MHQRQNQQLSQRQTPTEKPKRPSGGGGGGGSPSTPDPTPAPTTTPTPAPTMEIIDGVIYEPINYYITGLQYVVTGVDDYSITEINIQPSVQGVDVTKIDYSAFDGCNDVESITIPDSINEIYPRAFSDTAYYKNEANWEDGVLYIGNHLIETDSMAYIDPNYRVKEGTVVIVSNAFRDKAIETITLPASVDYIGYGVFDDCDELTDFIVHENNLNYSSNEDGILFNKDKKVLIECPENADFTEYTIPSNVTEIEPYAFNSCNNITKITIPPTVSTIGFAPFAQANLLSSSEVDANNTHFLDENGILFNKNKSELIQYPAGKTEASYTIPSGISVIGSDSFNGCRNLQSIIIPEGVAEICTMAFANCGNLSEVKIPASTTKIYNMVFDECDGLTAINVDESNENYASIDGVLLSKDGKKLIKYPSAKIGLNYTIPSTVTTINNTSVTGIKGAKNIIIPNTVSEISVYSFSAHFADLSGLFRIFTTVERDNVPIGWECDWASDNDQVYWAGEWKYSESGTPVIPEIVIKDNIEYKPILNNGVWSYEVSKITGETSVVVIESTIGTYPVTSIGEKAFYNCTSLTTINIPKSVTEIKEGVFSNCSSLNAITVDPENEIFTDDKGVLIDKSKKILMKYPEAKISLNYKIPSGVVEIAKEAFSNNKKLMIVTITKEVEIINDFTFKYCENLTSVTIEGALSAIGPKAFSGCNKLEAFSVVGDTPNFESENGVLFNAGKFEIIIYPMGKTAISYTIPSSVTTIGESIFEGCTTLTTVTIPSSITTIGDSAFQGCVNITDVVIEGTGLKTIGDRAFYECENIANITIPTSVTAIGKYAFFGCRDITIIAIPEGVTVIENSTFSNCSSLDNLVIPSQIESIGVLAFDACYSLKSLIIEEGVKTIGTVAFRDCVNLKEVTIPRSMEKIESSIFIDCRSLKSVIIPSTVAIIEDKLFSKCPADLIVYTDAEIKPQDWDDIWNVGYDGKVTKVCWNGEWGYNTETGKPRPNPTKDGFESVVTSSKFDTYYEIFNTQTAEHMAAYAIVNEYYNAMAESERLLMEKELVDAPTSNTSKYFTGYKVVKIEVDEYAVNGMLLMINGSLGAYNALVLNSESLVAIDPNTVALDTYVLKYGITSEQVDQLIQQTNEFYSQLTAHQKLLFKETAVNGDMQVENIIANPATTRVMTNENILFALNRVLTNVYIHNKI